MIKAIVVKLMRCILFVLFQVRTGLSFIQFRTLGVCLVYINRHLISDKTHYNNYHLSGLFCRLQ